MRVLICIFVNYFKMTCSRKNNIERLTKKLHIKAGFWWSWEHYSRRSQAVTFPRTFSSERCHRPLVHRHPGQREEEPSVLHLLTLIRPPDQHLPSVQPQRKWRQLPQGSRCSQDWRSSIKRHILVTFGRTTWQPWCLTDLGTLALLCCEIGLACLRVLSFTKFDSYPPRDIKVRYRVGFSMQQGQLQSARWLKSLSVY